MIGQLDRTTWDGVPLEWELRVEVAIEDLVEHTPGARCLEDVERLTGRHWADLLTEEAGIPREIVRGITGR